MRSFHRSDRDVMRNEINLTYFGQFLCVSTWKSLTGTSFTFKVSACHLELNRFDPQKVKRIEWQILTDENKSQQQEIKRDIERIKDLQTCDSVMLELLSHFGCDLLSLLAVSLQVFDLHRQHAVPHHQHGFLVWEQRTPRTSRRRTGTHTSETVWGKQSDSPHWFLSGTSLRPRTSTTFFQFIVSVGGERTGRSVLTQSLNLITICVMEDIWRSERHNASANCEQNAAPFHTFFSHTILTSQMMNR